MRAKCTALYIVLLLQVMISRSVLAAQLQTKTDSTELKLAKVPLVFEPNRGQADGEVRFLSHSSTYTAFLETNRAVFVLPRSDVPDGVSASSVIALDLIGANKEATSTAFDSLPGRSNYYIGWQPDKWVTGVPQYNKVGFKSIYAGIDVLYYGHEGSLEYDFIVSPGANPNAIRFRVTGAERVQLDDQGNLQLRIRDKQIVLYKPVIYQRVSGKRNEISGRFIISGSEIGLALGRYDRRRALIIDPVLGYSTLIGANNDTQVQGVAVDSYGNVYIAGTTFATNYPIVSAFQGQNNGYTDVFVTKLSAAGNKILYSTYLGGGGFDAGRAIAVDTAGSAYVTGNIGGGDFPTTPGAFMTTCPGICNTPFVSKLLTDGTLSFSTYMGGSNTPANAIAVDSAGEAYITGDTASNDLPTTPGSFEPIYPGGICTNCYNGYVEKLNSSGTALVYSTYFGSAVGPLGTPSTAGSGIAVDAAGSAYIVGNTTGIPVQNPIQASVVGGPDAFIAKFSPDGSALVFSTYLGGTSPFFFGEAGDYATGVAVDPFGNVHVTGTSSSCEFPLSLSALSTDCVTTGYDQKIFAVTLNSSGSQLLFSTFVRSGFAGGVAVDAKGNTYITGTTSANDLPVLNAIENTSQQASAIGFISEFDLSGKLLSSTYLGATNGGSQPSGMAVDSKKNIYVVGEAQGDFPILHPIKSQTYQNTYYTFFVAKITPKSKVQFSLSPRVSPVLALRNVSSAPLTISAITPSPNFTVGGTCTSSLAPGAGCTLILEGAADNKTTGTVTIASNAYTKPQKFVIKKSPYGDNVGPILSIFPTYLRFPVQLTGTTSSAQQVVIANSGLLPAAIDSIQMIQPSAFNQTNDCPPLLNPGTSCTVSVTYTAATQQDYAQVAIIADPNQTRYTLFLGGVGSLSAIAAATSSVQFGTQFVGAAPLGRMVNVTNTTPYTSSITGVSTSAEFAQSNTCTSALAPQGSCRVLVTYAPVTNENTTGTLTISGLGPGAPQNVSLYGTGLLVSSLAVSPMPLELYGVVGKTSASGSITLTNTSQSSVQLLGFQISGSFSQTNNCPASLASGASCSISVTFTPTQSGVFNGSVSISNSGPNSPQVGPIVGTAQTVLTVNPTVVDFGQQKLNVKVHGYFSMGNGTGYPTVTVSSVTVQGTDFSLPPRTCPLSYPPFTGCSWEVDFTPSQTGVRTGTVTIVANDSPLPHIVSLQGVGVSNGQASFSASSLNFGTQPVGTQSQAQQVTLSNTGTGVLKLSGISISQQYSQTNNCGASLAVGASCTISIQFVPTLQGILEGTLSVQDDGLGSPQTIALTGIGQ